MTHRDTGKKTHIQWQIWITQINQADDKQNTLSINSCNWSFDSSIDHDGPCWDKMAFEFEGNQLYYGLIWKRDGWHEDIKSVLFFLLQELHCCIWDQSVGQSFGGRGLDEIPLKAVKGGTEINKVCCHGGKSFLTHMSEVIHVFDNSSISKESW